MGQETVGLLVRAPRHQTPLSAPSLIAEVHIAAAADEAVATGTAAAGVPSLTTGQIASGVALRKVVGAADLVIGTSATAIATSTRMYDPGMHLGMTVIRLSEIYREILVTRGILATPLTAMPARNSTGRALWPLSLSPLRRVSRQHHH